jgi:tRNA A-37 threonylcarbamoyl transferase component Bud32
MPSEEEKSEIIEAALDRIRARAEKYFPDLGGSKSSGELVAWLTPEKLRSSNPVYVIEIGRAKGHEVRRAVAKYVPVSDCPAGPDVEFKILSELSKSREFKKLGFAVPRPLDSFDDLRVLVTEMVDGEKLPALLARENGRLASREKINALMETMTRCGAGLRLIHGRGVVKTAPLPPDLSGRLEKTSSYLEEKGLFNKGEIMEIVGVAIAKIGVRPLTYVRQHGDYNIGNLLMADGKIVILDFAYTREDLPHNDVGRFVMALETFLPLKKNPLFDFGKVPALCERFLEGYYGGADRSPLDQLLVSLYKLRMTLIHFKARHESYSRRKKSAHLLVMNRLYRKRALDTLAEIRKYTSLI